jgi:hypothetical protein
MSDPKHHHFVPKLLLRPWLVENNLHGYWWNARYRELCCKRRGLDAFCNQFELLALRTMGRARYDLEKVFFGEVDDRGAKARDMLLNAGPHYLTLDQRCDFVRLLLSLEARRPYVVNELIRGRGGQFLRSSLDSDSEVIEWCKRHGITSKPSEYYETLGMSLEDRALLLIQSAVENPRVGAFLLNAQWHVARLGSFEGSFVLSDRPLIRLQGFDKPGAVWALPLTPRAVFVAANHIENLSRIKRLSGSRLAKEVNRSSAQQVDRFVFSVDDSDKRWIARRLQKAPRMTLHQQVTAS